MNTRRMAILLLLIGFAAWLLALTVRLNLLQEAMEMIQKSTVPRNLFWWAITLCGATLWLVLLIKFWGSPDRAQEGATIIVLLAATLIVAVGLQVLKSELSPTPSQTLYGATWLQGNLKWAPPKGGYCISDRRGHTAAIRSEATVEQWKQGKRKWRIRAWVTQTYSPEKFKQIDEADIALRLEEYKETHRYMMGDGPDRSWQSPYDSDRAWVDSADEFGSACGGFHGQVDRMVNEDRIEMRKQETQDSTVRAISNKVSSWV